MQYSIVAGSCGRSTAEANGACGALLSPQILVKQFLLSMTMGYESKFSDPTDEEMQSTSLVRSWAEILGAVSLDLIPCGGEL